MPPGAQLVPIAEAVQILKVIIAEAVQILKVIIAV
jgi:hypothetical protein